MTTNKFEVYENNDIVYTNKAKAKPRSLEELLKLDTYQGMTDDEIRFVMAYKERMAYLTSLTDANNRIYKDMVEKLTEQAEEKSKESYEIFKRAMSFTPDFK